MIGKLVEVVKVRRTQFEAGAKLGERIVIGEFELLEIVMEAQRRRQPESGWSPARIDREDEWEAAEKNRIRESLATSRGQVVLVPPQSLDVVPRSLRPLWGEHLVRQRRRGYQEGRSGIQAIIESFW